MKRAVVVGAGISGLAIAFRLQQSAPTAQITVLEENTRPGGTIWTEHRAGFQIECGANGFLDSNPSTLALCRDLGLADQLVVASEAASRKRYLFLQGRLHLLPGSLVAFLRSDLLSWRGKLALLCERWRKRRGGRADESIAAFARRRAGAEIAEVLADAVVTGIHAGDPALLSMRATFPRLWELEQTYGSVLKGLAATARRRRAEAALRGEPAPGPAKLCSCRQGLGRLIETLRDRLARPPVLAAAVRRLEQAAAAGAHPAWIVHGDGQDSWPADAVVLACPAYQQAAILHDLDAELSDRIGAIAYNRLAVVALGYRRADIPGNLDGFGYLAPQRARRDVLGVQWCSSIFPSRAPEGMVLLRCMCGGWHRPEVAGWEDARLLAAVRAELRLAMGIDAAPLLHAIIRWDRAIPQYHVGHLQRLAWIGERAGRYPGLFLAGNAYRGVAVNDCTEQAGIVARAVQQYLQSLEAQP